MVEVFKTNVSKAEDAACLVVLIHQHFKNYRANFDLDDCDHILRIEHQFGTVPAEPILHLLAQHGFNGEILSDDEQPFEFYSIFQNQKGLR